MFNICAYVNDSNTDEKTKYFFDFKLLHNSADIRIYYLNYN